MKHNTATLMEKYPESFAIAHLDEVAFKNPQELVEYLKKLSKEELGNKYDTLLLPVPNFTKNCTVEVIHPEFLCLCPKTGLPDIAKFTITYRPDVNIAELKSFKLFCTLFRNIGIFHENVTELLGGIFMNEISPLSLEIRGDFNARGGVFTTVYYKKSKDDTKEV